MDEPLTVKIAENIELTGVKPIVILGPNGSGKTKHAVDMSNWNPSSLVGALRNIELSPNISMQSRIQAEQNLTNNLTRRKTNYWQLSNEINELFSKLLAEDGASAKRFRDQMAKGKKTEPEVTKVMQLESVWSDIFPGRTLSFDDHKPTVTSNYADNAEPYSAQRMSDGERVALYLAARVIDSDQPLVIVDEPEVHFHSRLATRFWNEMQKLRPDCRFVYVTHDLPFALSRGDSDFIVIMPNSDPQVIDISDEMPTELAESLLAAASFSIHAKRIVFCEGLEGPSLDQELYSSWFNNDDTAVIPVESCENVIRCTTSFGNDSLVVGVDSIGIVDRDYWPDNFIESLPEHVNVLSQHEVENLLCLPDVFAAIAAHLGIPQVDAHGRYEETLNAAKEAFTSGLLHKQISERYRRRCEHQFRQSINGLASSDDFDIMSAAHIDALDSAHWDSPPADILAEEKARLENALAGSVDDFLQYFPGKVFFKRMSASLNIAIGTYTELVCAGLRSSEGDDLHSLGVNLEQALIDHLPARAT